MTGTPSTPCRVHPCWSGRFHLHHGCFESQLLLRERVTDAVELCLYSCQYHMIILIQFGSSNLRCIQDSLVTLYKGTLNERWRYCFVGNVEDYHSLPFVLSHLSTSYLYPKTWLFHLKWASCVYPTLKIQGAWIAKVLSTTS